MGVLRLTFMLNSSVLETILFSKSEEDSGSNSILPYWNTA